MKEIKGVSAKLNNVIKSIEMLFVLTNNNTKATLELIFAIERTSVSDYLVYDYFGEVKAIFDSFEKALRKICLFNCKWFISNYFFKDDKVRVEEKLNVVLDEAIKDCIDGIHSIEMKYRFLRKKDQLYLLTDRYGDFDSFCRFIDNHYGNSETCRAILKSMRDIKIPGKCRTIVMEVDSFVTIHSLLRECVKEKLLNKIRAFLQEEVEILKAEV